MITRCAQLGQNFTASSALHQAPIGVDGPSKRQMRLVMILSMAMAEATHPSRCRDAQFQCPAPCRSPWRPCRAKQRA